MRSTESWLAIPLHARDESIGLLLVASAHPAGYTEAQIDIDHIKKVNDTHGHQVIQTVAGRNHDDRGLLRKVCIARSTPGSWRLQRVRCLYHERTHG